MATIVVMPQLGNSVESCIIVEWTVAEGDAVSLDQTLCSIETDKSTMEVPSTAEGTVLMSTCGQGTCCPALGSGAVGDGEGESGAFSFQALPVGSVDTVSVGVVGWRPRPSTLHASSATATTPTASTTHITQPPFRPGEPGVVAGRRGSGAPFHALPSQ